MYVIHTPSKKVEGAVLVLNCPLYRPRLEEREERGAAV